jgi:hypothetical protein
VSTDDGEWDFYYCQVDDAPASIFLNFALREARPSGLDTLHFVGLQILEPGDHGMGVEPDVAKLWDLEDKITEAAAAKGFTYVGRLRNGGDWQITFYAAGNRESELEQLVVDALAGADRGYRTGSKEDADWSYYDEFLTPDAERWQWIMDRRVVTQLAKAGDVHETPRPVDHFIGFPDAAARDAFMNAARERGFSAEAGDTRDQDENPHTVQLVRSDPVTLQHIHDVVMDVVELAAAHGGEYDGWGAPIASASPPN